MPRLLAFSFAVALIWRAAAGEAVNLKLSTPAIEKISTRMAARAGKIGSYKAAGSAGEASTGLLEARPIPAQSLHEKKAELDAIRAENDDRTALFRELALANGLADTEKISVAYARAMRQSAPPDCPVQNPNSGAWLLKKDWRE